MFFFCLFFLCVCPNGAFICTDSDKIHRYYLFTKRQYVSVHILNLTSYKNRGQDAEIQCFLRTEHIFSLLLNEKVGYTKIHLN